MIRYFALHPTAANLLMVSFVMLGVFVLPTLRRETFPDFSSEVVEIRIPYPGATAEVVEEVVCQRVEDALDGVKFIKKLTSEAREGIAIITAEMDDKGDIQEFRDEIQTEIDAIDDFPADVLDSIISQIGLQDSVLTLLVSGPMSVPDLKAYCEELKDRLQESPEVSLVRINGFSDHQFRIELSPEALIQYEINVREVADIVSEQTENLPAGTVKTNEQDILVRFLEEHKSPLELENIIILAGRDGAEIRLRDIAKVTDLFELEEEKIMYHGQRAALLNIEKTKIQDTIQIADVVKKIIQEEQERYPYMTLKITQDISILVTDRLNLLIENGVVGLLLVFLSLWLFFNLKLSFWVTMSLPVSFLGASFCMPHLDLTINMITMVGILLALGLLMDDGIVIAENIATHRAKGKSAMEAAIDGVNEVKSGVISSFFTTVCILAPMLTMKGNIGTLLKAMPLVLILVMAVSLIEAFFILPAHLGHSLHAHNSDNQNFLRKMIDRFMDLLRDQVLSRIITQLIHWRYLFIGLVFFFFLFSIGMMVGGIVKSESFPSIDGNSISAQILLPQGTPLKRMEELVDQITSALDRVNEKFKPRQPDGQDLVQIVYIKFNENLDAFESGPHVATVNVDLLNAEIRDARIDDVLQAWREEVGTPPDVLNLTFKEPDFGPAGRPIEILLQGRDLDRTKKAASEMQAWLSIFDGVYDVNDDLRPGKPELRVRLREGAMGLGFKASGLARQLRDAFYGVTAEEIQVEAESYELDVRLDTNNITSQSDVENFRFTHPNGTQIPLSSVAIVETTSSWARIARVNGLRTITLRGNIDSRIIKTGELISLLKQEFLPDFIKKYPDIKISYEGEVKENGETQASMVRAMMIGLFGIFVLLSIQFRSYIEPLIVMSAIPLAFIGVIWGHFFIGMDISSPSQLGFMSLAGIVVNDSILLVLFLKKRRQEGFHIFESAAQASRDRFRAIVLTSVTTIAGLAPLSLEKSFQAQALVPLAVSITSGLMASTILVLLVIPCLYVILGDWNLLSKSEEVGKPANWQNLWGSKR